MGLSGVWSGERGVCYQDGWQQILACKSPQWEKECEEEAQSKDLRYYAGYPGTFRLRGMRQGPSS